MTDLLQQVVAAHGGQERWNQFTTLQVSQLSGGKLLAMEQLAEDPTPRTVTVWLHEQRLSARPFGAPDTFSDYTPTHVAIRRDNGEVVAERSGTPAQLHEQLKNQLWGPLGMATFNGYAMSNYMNVPYFMLLPGMQVREVAPHQERDETWRVLEASFPPELLSHSRQQLYYFDDQLRLRRQDYRHTAVVNPADAFDTAHYVYDYVEVQGLKFPTTRRAYKRDTNNRPIMSELMIWLDLSDIKLLP